MTTPRPPHTAAGADSPSREGQAPAKGTASVSLMKGVTAHVDERGSIPLFRHHVRRRRLTELLDATGARTILLVAPAGYGKTTLAAEWLQGRDAVGWYRARPGSADVAAFAAGLADAISPVTPAGERLKQRLRGGDAPEEVVDALAALLAEDLRAWPADAWLVVDDYHLIAGSPPAERFLASLIELAPLQTLITSRIRPQWVSARGVIYGEMLELTHESLAMTRAEAAQALELHSGRAADAIIDRAAGWPALLGLAALAETSSLPEDHLSDVLFRYFAEEVVRSQSSEVQDFMLEASVLASVEPDAVRAVTGRTTTGEAIDALRARGLLEAVGDEFRFHPLLHEFLRRKFETEQPEHAKEAFVRAVEHAVGRRDWDQAFSVALRASLSDSAADVLTRASPELLATGRLETLQRWLHTLDEVGHHGVATALVRAELLLRRGRFVEARHAAESVSRQLPPGDARSSRALLVAGQAAHFVADDEAALAYHRRAREVAADETDHANATWGAFIAAGALELDEAEDYLEAYETTAAASRDSRLRALAGREVVAGLRGSYAPLLPVLPQIWTLARECEDPMVRTNAQSTVIWLSVLRSQYLRAIQFADEALAYTRSLRIDFASAFFLALRGSAEVGVRRTRAGRASLSALQRTDAWVDDPYLQTAGAILELKIALTESSTASSLLAAFEPPRLHFPEFGEYLALRAIAQAGAGETQRALEEADRADELSRCTHIRFSTRFARLLVDLTRLGPDDDGVRSGWRLAVLEAQACGCLDPFVMAYRAHPTVLAVLQQQRDAARVVDEVLVAANDGRLARDLAGGSSERDAGLVNRLTRREREVADLVRVGRTNQEIAERLVISLSTAKVHVRNVLRKTGTRSRAELAGLLASEATQQSARDS
jgi:DNA-binding CsgD family transcriptional regulator/tetratricopeptide (TPR) repeat protein